MSDGRSGSTIMNRKPVPAIVWLLCALALPSLLAARCQAADDSAAKADATTTNATPAGADDSGDKAVQSGQKALTSPVDRFPWYDAEHDTVRRVEIQPSTDDVDLSQATRIRDDGQHGSYGVRYRNKARGRQDGKGGNADSGDDMVLGMDPGDSAGGGQDSQDDPPPRVDQSGKHAVDVSWPPCVGRLDRRLAWRLRCVGLRSDSGLSEPRSPSGERNTIDRPG